MIESEVGRRVRTAGHFYNNPAEMRQSYFDVLNTDAQFGIAMPRLMEIRKRVESFPMTP